MPTSSHRFGSRSGFAALPMILLAAVILGVIGFVVLNNNKAIDGPKPVIWDKTPCSFCAMHLGDPRFAAQLTTEDGTTHFFDDPGCLFLLERDFAIIDTKIHARWFRQLDSETWLSTDNVAFQHTEGSPMDYGLGAVPAGSPASITLEEATAEVLSR